MRPEVLECAAHRLLVDILLEADERYWMKRAKDFAKVGTPDCDEIARACRAKAAVCRRENADEWAELLAAETSDAA